MRDELKILLISKGETEVKEYSLNSLKIISFTIVIFTLLGVSSLWFVNGLTEWLSDTRMANLKRTNTILIDQVSSLNSRIDSLFVQLNYISEKDDDIRLLMDLPELLPDIRLAGIGGARVNSGIGENLDEFFLDDYSRTSLLNSYEKIQQLERQVKFEMLSYASLNRLVKNKKDSLRFMPAIFPCEGRRLTDGFGNRRHPITGRIAFHEGIDIAAKIGNPVYATADGIVEYVGRNGGYGKSIFVNHKNGFQTRFAHLNSIGVKKGQFVKRGDVIGGIGETGRSTGPHLHYEVRFHRKPLDPKGFFFDERYLK